MATITTIVHNTIESATDAQNPASEEDVARLAPLFCQRWFIDRDEATRELAEVGLVADTADWELV